MRQATRQGSGAWLDAAVILGLMAMILSIFDDTFADRSYLVAGLVPVVVLLALALVTSRMQEGGWWYALAGLVLFSPLGALAALREPGPFVVPTLDTMSGLLADSVGAPITLVSTVPPVDPTGEVMLVPFLIGFLATLPAAWLALGTSRPLAPVVPIALGLAATIPLGVLVPTLLVPRGIVVGIVLVAWGAVRARRREDVTGTARGSAAATTTAVLTVALVSGVVSLLVPDVDQSDRVLLSGDDNTPLLAGASLLPPEREGFRLLLKATGVPARWREPSIPRPRSAGVCALSRPSSAVPFVRRYLARRSTRSSGSSSSRANGSRSSSRNAPSGCRWASSGSRVASRLVKASSATTDSKEYASRVSTPPTTSALAVAWL